jgi:hypothetical protein
VGPADEARLCHHGVLGVAALLLVVLVGWQAWLLLLLLLPGAGRAGAALVVVQRLQHGLLLQGVQRVLGAAPVHQRLLHLLHLLLCHLHLLQRLLLPLLHGQRAPAAARCRRLLPGAPAAAAAGLPRQLPEVPAQALRAALAGRAAASRQAPQLALLLLGRPELAQAVRCGAPAA